MGEKCLNDEWLLDPKVAQDFAEKAYKVCGVKNTTPVFRDNELYFTSKSIADGMKEIYKRCEDIRRKADLYTNYYIDIYHDHLVADRGLDLSLVREFFKAGFLEACHRFGYEIERMDRRLLDAEN